MPIDEKLLENIRKDFYDSDDLNLSYEKTGFIVTEIEIQNLFEALASNTWIKSVNLSGNQLDKIFHLMDSKVLQKVKIEKLILSKNNLDSRSTENLLHLIYLKCLILTSNEIDDNGLATLLTHPTIDSLSVDSNKINGKIIIPENQQIRYLDISCNDIDDVNLIFIYQLKKLESLAAESCSFACEAGRVLANCYNLKRLNIDDNELQDIGAGYVVEKNRLVSLSIRGNRLTSIGVINLLKASNLTDLSLGDNISEDILSVVRENQSLNKLNIESRLLHENDISQIQLHINSNKLRHIENKRSFIEKLIILACDNLQSSILYWSIFPLELKSEILKYSKSNSSKTYGKSDQEMDKLIDTIFKQTQDLRISIKTAVIEKKQFQIKLTGNRYTFWPLATPKNTTLDNEALLELEKETSKRRKFI